MSSTFRLFMRERRHTFRSVIHALWPGYVCCEMCAGVLRTSLASRSVYLRPALWSWLSSSRARTSNLGLCTRTRRDWTVLSHQSASQAVHLVWKHITKKKTTTLNCREKQHCLVMNDLQKCHVGFNGRFAFLIYRYKWNRIKDWGIFTFLNTIIVLILKPWVSANPNQFLLKWPGCKMNYSPNSYRQKKLQ